MRSLELRTTVTESGTVELSLAETDVADPQPHEVVVRVEAAPINPSDLGLLLAGADPSSMTAGGTPDRPTVTAPLPPPAQRAAAARLGQPMPAGNEGAGTVVAAGSSPEAQALLGKVVAAAGGGMYAQYRAVPAGMCLELPDGVTAEEGASSFVNPMTVLGMIETMRAEGHTALVHTAAASNLGQMLNRVCLEEGIGLVNVVRSQAQAALLSEAGAKFVCNSSEDGFMASLIEAVQATGATLAFDAIGGGRVGSQILTAMEAAAAAGAEFSRYGSNVHKQLYIYGGLDRSPTELTRSFGYAWGVGGWLLTPFLMKAGMDKVQQMRERVVAGVRTTFASRYTATVSLAGALNARTIGEYGRQATGQKYLITPNA
ncbi:MAG TPA: zinc-binding dehydrogenase [Acidimicrobiales bacterium]|nr:zinc-binding dehydrogenase [Acidimicrobiales bacterium]